MPSLSRTRAVTRELAATERAHEALNADLDRVLLLQARGKDEAAERLLAETNQRQRELFARQRIAWRNASRVARAFKTERQAAQSFHPGENRVRVCAPRGAERRPAARRTGRTRARAPDPHLPDGDEPPPLDPFQAEADAWDEIGLESLGDEGQP